MCECLCVLVKCFFSFVCVCLHILANSVLDEYFCVCLSVYLYGCVCVFLCVNLCVCMFRALRLCIVVLKSVYVNPILVTACTA